MVEDNKRTQDISKEDKNKDSRAKNLRYLELIKAEGAKKIIEELNETAKEAREEAKAKKEEPAFVTKFGTKVPYESILPHLDIAEQKVIDTGYTVEILEDTEYINVTTGSRFNVRITYINQTYVEFDLNKYKESLLDYDFDAVEYIEGLLTKIIGDSSDETFKSAIVIVKYLSYAIYYPEAYVRTYTRIGWDYLYNHLVFKYDEIYSNANINGKCIGGIEEGLEPVRYGYDEYEIEDKNTWISEAIKILNYSTTDCLLFGASVSGVIRQLLPYTKETNININIVGERASGKSTICHYLLSTFGNPAKLEGSFTDTTNRMEEIRSSRPVLPYILDERMLRIEEESEKNKRKSIIMDIFREYEGKVKERVGKQYKTLSGARTCGPIISSSVKSMMDEIYDYTDIGQFRRFIELSVTPKDLFADKEMAEETETIANTCYGYGVKVLVNYILYTGRDYVLKKFDNINKYISGVLKEKDNISIESSSQRFALIITSYQILREAIIFEVVKNDTDLWKDIEVNKEEERINEAVDILKESLMSDMKQTEQVDEDLKELIKFRVFNDERIQKAYEDIAKSNDFISNKAYDILDILINNITEKMEKVKVYEKPENHILEYIENHKDAFCWNEDGWSDTEEIEEEVIEEQDGETIKRTRSKKADMASYIGKISCIEGHSYTITLIKSLEIEKLLFAKNSPTVDKLKKYIKEKLSTDNSNKDIEAKALFNKMNPLSDSQLEYFLKEYPWISIQTKTDDDKDIFSVFYRGEDNKYTKEGKAKAKTNWGKQRAIIVTIDLEAYNKLKATEEKEGV